MRRTLRKLRIALLLCAALVGLGRPHDFGDLGFFLPGTIGILGQRTTSTPTTVGAVGFGATAGGERLRPGTVFTSKTNWSACGWVKITTDRNDYSGVFAFEHGGHSDYYAEAITDSNGTTLVVYDNAAIQATFGSLTVNTWYFWGMKVGASGALTAYLGTEGLGSLTKVTGTVDTGGTFDQTTIAATNFASTEYLIGNMAQVRAWNDLLSDAEFYNEKISATLVKTTNVLGWWELTSSANRLVDSYGSNTLGESGFGSFTTETGPTIG